MRVLRGLEIEGHVVYAGQSVGWPSCLHTSLLSLSKAGDDCVPGSLGDEAILRCDFRIIADCSLGERGKRSFGSLTIDRTNS